MRHVCAVALVWAWLLPAAAVAASVAAMVRTAHDAYDRKEYARAVELYAAAIRAGANKPTTFYNAACSAALASRPNDAFSYLDRALDAGYTKADHLESDADFRALHADPRWAALVARVRGAAASLARSMREPALRDELLAMRRADLALRISRRGGGKDRPRLADIHAADAERTARLQKIVARHGWPGRSLVGVDGAHAAWLIARHADDLPFQRRCLELMHAAAAGEVDPQDLAALTDAILVDEGKKQVYGTMFHRVRGALVPYPFDDQVHVDARRKELGLAPFAEYQKQLESRHDGAADSTGP